MLYRLREKMKDLCFETAENRGKLASGWHKNFNEARPTKLNLFFKSKLLLLTLGLISSLGGVLVIFNV